MWSARMTYLIGYVSLLIVFGAVDALWLTTMGPILYRPALGDILAPQVRLGPAIAFYLIYPFGLLVFAVLPALKAESVANALVLGLLFGAIAYATYDLTNFATLRNWTLQITVIDIAYGAVVSGLAAAASAWLVRVVAR
jgi:uncharacterized membrane protein